MLSLYIGKDLEENTNFERAFTTSTFEVIRLLEVRSTSCRALSLQDGCKLRVRDTIIEDKALCSLS